MLTFDNVRFQYAVEDFSIIDHLSFEVQDGEFVSIIGASGCGKSTIFRLVNKLLTPASGVIRWMGNRSKRRKITADICRSRICCFHGAPCGESDASDGDSGRIFEGTDAEKADDALRSVGLADWEIRRRRAFRRYAPESRLCENGSDGFRPSAFG